MPPTTDTPDLRNEILARARHLLTREGYRDVSMRKIARAAGCSVSSIYTHFDSKDALIHTLIDEGFQRWYEEALTIGTLPEPPAERLQRLCRRYIEFGLENPELYEVMYLFRPKRMSRFPKELYRRTRRSLEMTTALLFAANPERYGTERAARLQASVGWSLLHGVVSTILAGRLDSRIDRDAYIDAAVDRVVSAAFGESVGV